MFPSFPSGKTFPGEFESNRLRRRHPSGEKAAPFPRNLSPGTQILLPLRRRREGDPPVSLSSPSRPQIRTLVRANVEFVDLPYLVLDCWVLWLLFFSFSWSELICSLVESFTPLLHVGWCFGLLHYKNVFMLHRISCVSCSYI